MKVETIYDPSSEYRTLPQDIEAERALLCCLLLAPREGFGRCYDAGTSEGWFAAPAHKVVFTTLEKMNAQGEPLDFVTLTTRLRDCGILDTIGGPSTITELFTFLPTAANMAYYLEILHGKFALREIIEACTNGVTRAYDEQDDVPGLLNEVEARIAQIASGRAKNKRWSQAQSIEELLGMIESGDEEKVWGMKTGFGNLDHYARGLVPGALIGVGGDKKAGKTALVENIIHNICVRPENPASALIVSLENTQKEVNEEMLQIGAGYTLDEMMVAAANPGGAVNERIRERTLTASIQLANAPITIRDEDDINILQIRAIARQMKPRIVVLDYAQLCLGSQRRYERDELRIAEVSRNCKIMAKELNATVFVISQLNDDGKAAGSRAIVRDCNQWWIVADHEDDAGKAQSEIDRKVVKICAGRRVPNATVEFKWIGALKKLLPKAL